MNQDNQEKTENHCYSFLGSKYKTRLECKMAIEKRGSTVKVTSKLFNALLELRIVRKFK